MTRYRVCAECRRKRRFTVAPESHGPRDPGHRWTCSKGHSWWEEIGTLEKMTHLLKEFYIEPLRKKFEQDSVFWSGRILK